MFKRQFLKKILMFVTVFALWTGQSVFASASWSQSVDVTFDTSAFDTILMYKDELYAGGLNLSTGQITTNQDEADLVINTYGDMGAGSMMDLGKIDYDQVTEVPDSGYTTQADAKPGHVYIVATHDGKFVKVLVKQVLANKVMMKYAFLQETSDSANNTNNQGIKEYVFEEGGVVISWEPVSGAASYDLYRADSGNNGEYVKLTDFRLTGTTFTDKYGIAGHTYFYKYKVYDGNGNVIAESKPIQVRIVAKQNTDSPANSSVIILQINNTLANVNGSNKTLDVAPMIVDGRTLVPLRFIAEALDATVDWLESEQRITLKLGGDTLVLWVNNSAAQINGETVYMDVPPKVVNDRTLVPVRFVSENLKQDVAFEESTQTITITSKGSSQPSNQGTSSTDFSSYFSTFNLYMPGSYVDGKYTPGADNGTLTIDADGTYTWDSLWDGKVITGTWRVWDETDGYPIILENAQEGKDWKIGMSNSTIGGDILVWDGTFYYIGLSE